MKEGDAFFVGRAKRRCRSILGRRSVVEFTSHYYPTFAKTMEKIVKINNNVSRKIIVLVQF